MMVSKYYPQYRVWNCNFGDCLHNYIFVYHCLSIRLVNTNQTHLVRTFFFFFSKYNKIGGIVRKHLKEGFLCDVLDLSGILCSLLIPEYSGIKRRGKPLPGAEESRHFLY